MTPFSKVRFAGEGRDIVLVHGWSAHGGFFAAQAALAAEGFRLVMPDLPGHGENARPRAGLTIAALADSLAGWLASTEAGPKPLLVGWSMGAFVCLDYLHRFGTGDIAGLMMIDMTAKVANDAGWRLGLASGQGAAEMIAQSREMETGWAEFSARVARAIFARGLPPDPAMLAMAQAAMAANDGPTMAALWRDLAQADFRAVVAGLDLPVMAVLGARSRIYGPELGEWYRARGIAVEVFDRSGHAPHIEEPDRFNRCLAAFAREVSR